MGTSGSSGSMGSAGGSGCLSSVQALGNQRDQEGGQVIMTVTKAGPLGCELAPLGCLPPFFWRDEASTRLFLFRCF